MYIKTIAMDKKWIRAEVKRAQACVPNIFGARLKILPERPVPVDYKKQIKILNVAKAIFTIPVIVKMIIHKIVGISSENTAPLYIQFLKAPKAYVETWWKERSLSVNKHLIPFVYEPSRNIEFDTSAYREAKGSDSRMYLYQRGAFFNGVVFNDSFTVHPSCLDGSVQKCTFTKQRNGVGIYLNGRCIMLLKKSQDFEKIKEILSKMQMRLSVFHEQHLREKMFNDRSAFLPKIVSFIVEKVFSFVVSPSYMTGLISSVYKNTGVVKIKPINDGFVLTVNNTEYILTHADVKKHRRFMDNPQLVSYIYNEVIDVNRVVIDPRQSFPVFNVAIHEFSHAFYFGLYENDKPLLLSLIKKLKPKIPVTFIDLKFFFVFLWRWGGWGSIMVSSIARYLKSIALQLGASHLEIKHEFFYKKMNFDLAKTLRLSFWSLRFASEKFAYIAERLYWPGAHVPKKYRELYKSLGYKGLD